MVVGRVVVIRRCRRLGRHGHRLLESNATAKRYPKHSSQDYTFGNMLSVAANPLRVQPSKVALRKSSKSVARRYVKFLRLHLI